MRFVLFLILGLFLLSPNVFAEDELPPEGGTKKLFRITGYYSPLPNQSKYVRGSYEADVRLNGRGTNGADGTEVYPGMLAAPITYSFGTQIFLPGLGLGTVHDRGGAIVSAGNRGQAYDRIDVWMGKGEEGLARALALGSRIIEGILYPLGANVSSSFSWNTIPKVDLSFLPDISSVPTTTNTPLDVVTLQKALRELGFYDRTVNGILDESTTAAITDFQLAFDVITSAESTGAGNYGPKTQQTLSMVLQKQYQQKISEISHLTELFPAGLSTGSSGESVAHLQDFLKRSGLLAASTSGTFDEATEIAVKNFQLAHGVITSESEWGVGVFGPKTQQTLFQLFAERQENTSSEAETEIIATEFGTQKPREEKVETPHVSEPKETSSELIIAEFSPNTSSAEETTAKNAVAGFAPQKEYSASMEFMAIDKETE